MALFQSIPSHEVARSCATIQHRQLWPSQEWMQLCALKSTGNGRFKCGNGRHLLQVRNANRDNDVGGSGRAAGNALRERRWNLEIRPKARLLEAASRISDPFRFIFSGASRALLRLLDGQEKVYVSLAEEGKELDWKQWQMLFKEVDRHETLLSSTRFRLQEAIEEEDYGTASSLREMLRKHEAADVMSEVFQQLNTAVREERYEDAARLRDEGAAGLMGWWVGLPEDDHDPNPYGRVVNIINTNGRLVAFSYTAKQLSVACDGLPLFEVFVSKLSDRTYLQQAVYLRRDVSYSSQMAEENRQERKDGTQNDDWENSQSGANYERIRRRRGPIRFIRTLLDRSVDRRARFQEDERRGSSLFHWGEVDQMGWSRDMGDKMERVEEPGSAAGAGEGGEGGEHDLEDEGNRPTTWRPEGGQTGGRAMSSLGVEDRVMSKLPLRVPAKIERHGKDSFTLQIVDEREERQKLEGQGGQQSRGSITTEDVMWMLRNLDDSQALASREMSGIIRLAVTQVLKRRSLAPRTKFRRIDVPAANSDALSGIYVGAFGPYASEVLQLNRRVGFWKSETDLASEATSGGTLGTERQDSSSGNGNETEQRPSFPDNASTFCEYVEVMKLAGDALLPCGQVIFRARVSGDRSYTFRGVYPDELGVVARYPGEGRLGEVNMKGGGSSSRWTRGELLLLSGKGEGPAKGAELGFVYSAGNRHFLVLYNRLRMKA